MLFTNGRSDTWINPAGQWEVLGAAAPVYRMLGAGDFTAKELPPDGELVRGVLGYSLRPGGHSLLREDWGTFLDFADQHLGPPSRKEKVGRKDSAVGPIVIDREHPQSFLHQNGERFFAMGDTAYFLMGRPADVIAHFIDVRREHKFNFIRMMAMGDGFWPFGGTPAKPNYTVIDEAALRKMNWVFDYAAARGMNIELILWGYGVAGGEGLWGNEVHEQLWVDTLVKRYRDRQNLFMYTIANEFDALPGRPIPLRFIGRGLGSPRRRAHSQARCRASHRLPSVCLDHRSGRARPGCKTFRPLQGICPAGPRSFGPCGKAAM